MPLNRTYLAALAVAALLFPAGLMGADPAPGGPYRHKQLFGGDQPHQAVEEGDCTDCHAMHFPAAPGQLKAALPKLCEECHDPFPGKTVHKPVAQGRCTVCHPPHSAGIKSLLRAQGAALCVGCHKDKKGGTHRQGTMEGGCQTCHDPHATDSKHLLRGGMGGAQCLICHGKLVKGKVLHSGLAGATCDECHNPHANPPLPTRKCVSCHPEVMKGKLVHAPMEDGCSACHGSHSAPESQLLIAPVPALCLDCHDEKKGGKHGKRAYASLCTRCHTPHSSGARGLIKGEMGPDSCPQCHEEVLKGKASRHTPADSGECADCHNPHADPPVATVACTDCHDDLFRGRFVHEPAQGGCGDCHDSHASAFSFQLIKPVPALCGDCHDGMEGGLHGEIKLDPDCMRCHDPHSSSQPKALTIPISSTPCGTCHHFMKEGAVVHKPVAADDCQGCHNPHVQPPVKTVSCLECHPTLLAGTYAHAPAASSCLSCHFAHSGPSANLLTDEVPELCTGCHKANAEGRHGKAQLSPNCGECHLPHSGENPMLLRNMEERRCESCHTGKRSGKFLHSALGKFECKDCHNPHSNPPEMPPLSCGQCHPAMSDRRPSHGSAVQGRCVECHDPHGGDNRNLVKPVTFTSDKECLVCHDDIRRSLEFGRSVHEPLRKGSCLQCHTTHKGKAPFIGKAFATEFYTPYERNAYDLCWDCHDPSLVEVEFTEEDTRFRNGVRNLHYLHVVRDGSRGFSCWACHDSHAAYQKKLVNEISPLNPNYGLKIDLGEQDDGGSCATNCHSAERYLR
jgi:predicted CXXCH cytochrome family protein